MKVLAVTIRVKKDKIKISKSFFQSFIKPSRAEAGCVEYDLFQSATDEQVFYFFEKWKDDQAFQEHSSQSFLQEFKERYQELLEEPNKLLWLTPIE